MNHTEHDLDLLASWASGYEPDRRRAEEFMSQCPECAAFFTEQSQVRSLLAGMGSARLRTEEATSLLAAVSTAQPLPVTLKPKPISPIWNRLLGAAAALALVTAIGIAFRPSGGAGEVPTNAASGAASDSRAAESALEMQAATTMAASETTAATFGDATMAGDLDTLKTEADTLQSEPPEGAANAHRLAVECPALDLEILALVETTYQERETFLILVEEEGATVVKAYFADDCTEIVLP